MKIKRVIEIEEDTLKRIDEARSIPDMFGADIVNGLNAIKNGTSITELSDNIFANILLSEINKKGLAFEEVLLLIDNAPTVEEKSQGEWIDYDNTFYKCPDCGYLLEKCCPQCQNKVILPKGGADNEKTDK